MTVNYFQTANKLKQEGKLEEAIAYYRQAIEQNPSFYGAYQNLGEVLVKLYRLNDAVNYYCRAIQLNPKSAWSHYKMGEALTQLSRWDEAIASYQKAIDLRPDEDEIKRSCTEAQQQVKHLNRAERLKQEQKLSEATVFYQKAFAIKPGWPEAYFHLGHDLWQQERYSEALQSYQAAINLKPDFPEAHLHLGNALWQQGKQEATIKSYQQAVALKPNWAEAYLQLGNALLERGKYKEASKIYQEVIVLKPEIVEAHWQLGRALWQQGKHEEAIDRYQHSVALNPDWADAYYHLGNALWQQGKEEEAIEIYYKAVAIKPDWPEAFWQLGSVLWEQGKQEAAIESYQQAVALKPDWADAYYQLGNALWNHGKLDDAISIYEKAVSIKPDLTLTIGATLKEQGKLDEVIVIYQKALVINPELLAIYLQLCELFINKKNLTKARKIYEDLVDIQSNSVEAVEALCKISDAFRCNHEMEESISCCNYFIANRPSCIEAYSQLAKTLLIQGKMEEASRTYSQLNQVKFAKIRSQEKIGSLCLFTLPKSGSLYISNALIQGLSLRFAPHASVGIYNEIGQNLVQSALGEYNVENCLFAAHASATLTNKVLLSLHIDRLIVNVRDVRQSMLSMIHYFNNLRKTAPHFIFNYSLPNNYFDFSLSQQTDWQIENWYLQKAIKWIEEWLEAEEDPSFYPKILFTRYEDLVTNPNRFFDDILDFYELDRSIFKMPEKPLFKNQTHYRKGSLEEWRDVFTPEQSQKASSLIPKRLLERFGWSET